MEIVERGLEAELVPDWCGNLQKPQNERVVLRIRLITQGAHASREARRAVAGINKRGKGRVVKMAADEPFRVIREHVVSVAGIKLIRTDGTVVEPKTGSELSDMIRGQPQGEPWSSFMDEVLNFINGESGLEEETGNLSAASHAS